MTQKWNEVVTPPPTDIASRFYVACFFAGGFLASAFRKGATCRIPFFVPVDTARQQATNQNSRFRNHPSLGSVLGTEKSPISL